MFSFSIFANMTCYMKVIISYSKEGVVTNNVIRLFLA